MPRRVSLKGRKFAKGGAAKSPKLEENCTTKGMLNERTRKTIRTGKSRKPQIGEKDCWRGAGGKNH